MPCCKISNCAQMSKTIIAVRHFGLGGRESLETAVMLMMEMRVVMKMIMKVVKMKRSHILYDLKTLVLPMEK